MTKENAPTPTVGLGLGDLLGGDRRFTKTIDGKEVVIAYNPAAYTSEFETALTADKPKQSEFDRRVLEGVAARIVRDGGDVALNADTLKTLPIRFVRRVSDAVQVDIYSGE